MNCFLPVAVSSDSQYSTWIPLPKQPSYVQSCCQYRRTQDLDAKWILHWQNSVKEARAPENVYSVPAQEIAKHPCKVWLTSSERRRCSNEAKTWNPLKFAGCPKLANWSQMLVGWSSPNCEDMWTVEEILLFKKFFLGLSIHALGAKVQPDKVVRPVYSASRVQHISDLHSKFALRPHHSCGILCHTTCGQLTYLWPHSEIDWKHSCLAMTRSSAFAALANLGYTSDIIIIIIIMCGCMVDMQSATAENRQGKKQRKKKNKCSPVAEMGDCLATIDMGQVS